MPLTAPLRTPAAAVPSFGSPQPSFFARLLHAYQSLARREMLACGVVLVLTLGIRGLLLPVMPPPAPVAHDEFSYLLAADTFVSGRVANPTPPFWQHFEAFHELMQPVYASKYPALQGLVLAFGQKLFGQPWIGVYLSAGLMCAFVCWMLQAWIEADLALLGALLFLLRIGIFTAWMNSYWGGAIAAIGGSLVLGAMGRILFRNQAVHVITLAAGFAILMHSRPWEGAVLATVILVALAWMWRTWMSREWTPEFRRACMRFAAPGAAILLVALGAQAYLDYRITGNVFLMPHVLYGRQYIVAPLFVFQSLQPEPVYRHELIRRDFTEWHVSLWHAARYDFITVLLGKFSDIYNYFFGFWPLLIPALIWPFQLKTQAERLTVLLLLAFLATAVVPLADFQPHYIAPVVGLLYLRFLQTLSRLRMWRPSGWPVGWAFGLVFVGLIAYQFVDTLIFLVRYRPPVSLFAMQRADVLRQLESMAGKQLVLVRYTNKDHDLRDDWVWNRADIDASQIVWAREMGSAEDEPFLDHYRDRQVWLLDADASPPRLIPYSRKEATP